MKVTPRLLIAAEAMKTHPISLVFLLATSFLALHRNEGIGNPSYGHPRLRNKGGRISKNFSFPSTRNQIPYLENHIFKDHS